ncbi:MAG: molecular chaperone DnaJ [Acidimicrobiales bacterium]
MSTDYYALLEVSQTATADELKKAYRRLARTYHPDVNKDPEAETRFKEISKAYEVLSDPQRRARYDRFGPEEGAAAANGGGFSGFGGGIDDLLGMVMDGFGFAGAGGRSGRGPSGPPRGADQETVLDLGFEEAVFGTNKDVSLRTAVACEDCSGSGATPGTTSQTCPDCGGAGQVRRVRQSFLGQMVTANPCLRCSGQGQIIASPCPRCRGDGRVTEARTYPVEIPAGVDNGTTLRLSGRGAAGPRGGGAGDLYVHLRVAPHEFLERHGDDLHHRLPISFTQAALGATLSYASLDGDLELVIPRGTQSGTVFRFREHGVPQVRGRGRGDLLVSVEVQTPDDLDDEQEELLRRLAELRQESVSEPDRGLFARLRSAIR